MLKSINDLRRKLMHRITKNIGVSHISKNIDLTKKVKIKKILICRPNHRLGNLLLITPLIQEVIAIFPDCEIDLFIKGNLGPILYKNYENVNRIIKLPRKPFEHLINYCIAWISIKKGHYDLVINGDKNSSSGRLSTQIANSKYKVFGDVKKDIQLKYKDYEHTAKYPIYILRDYLTMLGFIENDMQIPTLNLKLSPFEISEGLKILRKLVNNEKKTICVFTYATGNKCYSEFWWTKFYERLKTECKDYNIIEVLPIENVSQIAFKAPTFYSKDIREIGSVMANTKLFIGADSGIMHLASSSQTTTVGLFSVTNQIKYQPYGNNSVAINTNVSDTNECIKIINRILIND